MARGGVRPPQPALVAGPPASVSAWLTWQRGSIPRVDVEDLSVLLSYLDRASLTVLETPTHARAELDLSEKQYPQADLPSNPPVWNGYSGSGDVTGAAARSDHVSLIRSRATQGNVVYCNYGRRVDFERVKTLVNGSIALVRYGRGFRGNEVLNAERYGAIGVIIYSDPADDECAHATRCRAQRSHTARQSGNRHDVPGRRVALRRRGPTRLALYVWRSTDARLWLGRRLRAVADALVAA